MPVRHEDYAGAVVLGVREIPEDGFAPDGELCFVCGRPGSQPYGQVRVFQCDGCEVFWYGGVSEHPARGWAARDPAGNAYIDHGAVHAPSPA